MTSETLPAETAKPKQQMTLRQNLESETFRNQIAMVLPKHLTPERMVRVALTATMKTPELTKCDQSSFFLAMLNLSQMGLEPDGRSAHLIPFRNNKKGTYEVQLIIDYKGLVQLAYRSGAVASIHADVIRDGDLFGYERGQVTCHVPWFLRKDADKPKQRGDVIGAYCEVKNKDGSVKCELMESEDIEAIRRRSKSGSSGPWVSDWNEMAKKTVFRRTSKWIPMSAELQMAFDSDDDRVINATSRNSRESESADSFARLLTVDALSEPIATPDDVVSAGEAFDQWYTRIVNEKRVGVLSAMKPTIESDEVLTAEHKAELIAAIDERVK